MDEEAATFFSYQKPDGSVNGDYLDGNFIRTCLLYGSYKTRGAILKPWREDLQLGGAETGGALYLHLAAAAAWEGRLILDTERHRDFPGGAANDARVNEWPEWTTVDKDRFYRVTGLVECEAK